MDDVATRTVRLPDDVTGLLRTLRDRLDQLVDDEPLVVLKATEKMEAIVADYGPIAARYITGDAISMPQVAEALGMTEKGRRLPLDALQIREPLNASVSWS
ncbi:hypothetical protein [Streptomyces sp. NPDC056549]|uniref:hypothetical protein n=1 Tax=Streptomyces sp. NPDC056549 TaxID=3345864 RepID=UPI003675D299